jgi:hypothetical protein
MKVLQIFLVLLFFTFSWQALSAKKSKKESAAHPCQNPLYPSNFHNPHDHTYSAKSNAPHSWDTEIPENSQNFHREFVGDGYDVREDLYK